MSYPKKKKHQAAQAGKSRGWMLPLFYLVLSFLLMILPLEGLVNSVKAVLSYVFIPQIRLSHSAVKYAPITKTANCTRKLKPLKF